MPQDIELSLPLGEVLPHTCWDDGLVCGSRVGVPGGITLPFLVRTGTESAPLLVQIRHFPAQACRRCGNLTYNGPLSVAVERALEARYQQEGVLPAEMEFETTQAAA